MGANVYLASEIQQITQTVRVMGDNRHPDYFTAIKALEIAFRPGGADVYFERHIRQMLESLMVLGNGRHNDYFDALRGLALAFGIVPPRYSQPDPPQVVVITPRPMLEG